MLIKHDIHSYWLRNANIFFLPRKFLCTAKGEKLSYIQVKIAASVLIFFGRSTLVVVFSVMNIQYLEEVAAGWITLKRPP